MTSLPARPPPPLPRQFVHSATEYAHYEALADSEECLHLPADQCDHRTFRCVVCCSHP